MVMYASGLIGEISEIKEEKGLHLRAFMLQAHSLAVLHSASRRVLRRQCFGPFNLLWWMKRR